ncbi:MAG: ABC transporter ATP-binding protein [Anaerolineae bacterium]
MNDAQAQDLGAQSPRREDVIIETRGLVKTYGLLPVLRKLDVDILRGQFVALLGPNGSGKSTLLRLLSGLSRPTAGRITIGGWELPKEAAAVRAQIGLVSHKPLVYENLTARENLLLCGRLYHVPNLEARVEEMLTKVGLEKRAHDLTRGFSRGMYQRLTIARALLHDPQVLLFDEPYTGLDQNAAAILDELLLAAHDGQRTIVMATHQLDRAAQLTDRVVILSRGKIAYDRASAELDTLQLAADYAEVTGMATAR